MNIQINLKKKQFHLHLCATVPQQLCFQGSKRYDVLLYLLHTYILRLTFVQCCFGLFSVLQVEFDLKFIHTFDRMNNLQIYQVSPQMFYSPFKPTVVLRLLMFKF